MRLIDALQRPVTKAVGYFPRGQFEGYAAQKAVLIAEGDAGEGGGRSSMRFTGIVT